MNKLPYERPVLVPHRTGLMNKFGGMPSMEPMPRIGGVAVSELLETYGSPLFVFDETTLVERYHELRDALMRRYPKVRMAWSMKTNYLDGVVKVFQREGAWIEVVSGFEWEKAIRQGFPADHIHFNGPFKPRPDLERALLAGTFVHIDHFDELLLAETIAQEHGIHPKVAIRLNMKVEGAPHWSRFGFNLESGEARDAANRILAGGHLELVGLHCHLGTFILDPNAYRLSATKLATFANELRKEHGVVVEFIDVGGGIPSHNTLKAQYLPGSQATPAVSRYAEALADGLATLDLPPSKMPTLVLENGRALVDDAGYLVSRVHATKRLSDGRRALVMDAGVNVLFTSYWYKHEVRPTRDIRGVSEASVLVGPLCMNIDVIRETLMFPPVNAGEPLVFSQVGAYNVTQWMQFITYRPAVVMVGADGQHSLLRRRETLESIVDHEELPAWL
ncbi:MAG: diaminopimelate decarboxylase [Deltaproteobacteria bacterium CG_4_9_14_3_um_filter_63_12]|nr:MAG: diaminopimelate decarboxylase [Deltaproteobacteria bacterium CG_4_9_14_3_um_filter_63_12]